MGQFHLGNIRLAGRRKEDQRKASRLTVKAPDFLQPNQLEKSDRGIRVGDTDHSVEIAGGHFHSIHKRAVFPT